MLTKRVVHSCSEDPHYGSKNKIIAFYETTTTTRKGLASLQQLEPGYIRKRSRICETENK